MLDYLFLSVGGHSNHHGPLVRSPFNLSASGEQFSGWPREGNESILQKSIHVCFFYLT